MANYYSIADGNLTDSNVFGRSVDNADVTSNTSNKMLQTWYTDSVSFYLNPAALYPIYGVAVHLYTRNATPIGTLDLEIVSPAGTVVATETYDTNLFTPYDGRNNLITVHPQNWQLLKLTSPLTIEDAGNYRIRLKTSDDNQIALMGTEAGIDVVNSTHLQINGSVTSNSPFADSNEQSICGRVTSKITPGSYGLGLEDFTIEGYYFFNSFNSDWNPLVVLGDGIHNGSYLAWGIIYNNAEKRIYFWRNYWKNSKSLVDIIAFANCVVPINQWTHISVSRKDTKLSFWLDGVCVGTQTPNRTNYSFIKNKKIQIGYFMKDGISYNSNMCVSNIRINKGVPRFDASFSLFREPLSLRINTPFLYAAPYNEFYWSSADNSTGDQQSFDVDANVFNDANEFKFTKNGTSSIPLTAANPFNGVDDYSLHLTGTSYYTAPETYGNFSTGDFTVESWIYIDDINNTRRIVTYSSNTSLTDPASYSFGLEIVDGVLSGFVAGRLTATLSFIRLTQGPLDISKWYHVAMVRKDNELFTYIDGVSTGAPITVPVKLNATDNPLLTIGAEKNGTLPFVGLISNLRVTRGTALYTADFNTIQPLNGASILEPAPLSAFSLTLDIQNALTLEPVWYNIADPTEYYKNTIGVTLTNDSPYIDSNESAIILHKDSRDYIFYPFSYSSSVYLADADFTIETWLKLTSMPAAYANATGSSLSTNSGIFVLFVIGCIYVWIARDKLVIKSEDNNTYIKSQDHNMSINTWYHIAIVRKNGTLTFYKDGIAFGSSDGFTSNSLVGAWPGSIIYTKSETPAEALDRLQVGLHIGIGLDHWTSSSHYFDGSLIGFRIVRGTAIYTGNFNSTLPGPGAANIVSPEPLLPYVANTSTGTYRNNGVIVSSTDTPRVRIPSSSYFNGQSCYTIKNASTRIGTADFTIECWFKAAADTGYANIFDTDDVTAFVGNKSITIPIHDNYILPNSAPDGTVFAISWRQETGPASVVCATNISLNTWYHVAFVREKKNIRIYLNGAEIVNKIYNTVYGVPNTRDKIIVGRGISASSGYAYGYPEISTQFKGYIADFRFMRGIAVYNNANLPDMSADAPLLPTLTTSINVFPLQHSHSGCEIIDTELPPLFNPNTPNKAMKLPGYMPDKYQYGGPTIKYQSTPLILPAPTLSGDFTIEAWLYPETSSRDFYIFESGSDWSITSNKTNGIQFNSAGGYGWYTKSWLSASTWSHIAVCRKDDNWYMYVNGYTLPLIPIKNDSSAYINFVTKIFKSATTVKIGRDFNGRLLTAQINNGEAKYYTSSTSNSITINKATVEPETALLINTTGNLPQQNVKVYNTAISPTYRAYTPRSISIADLTPDGQIGIYDSQVELTNQYVDFVRTQFEIECWVKAPIPLPSNEFNIHRFKYDTVSTSPADAYIQNIDSIDENTNIQYTYLIFDASGSTYWGSPTETDPNWQRGGFSITVNPSTGRLSIGGLARITLSSSTSIKNNEWTKIKVARTSTHLQIYIDDILSGSTACSISTPFIDPHYHAPINNRCRTGYGIFNTDSPTSNHGNAQYDTTRRGAPFTIAGIKVSVNDVLKVNMLVDPPGIIDYAHNSAIAAVGKYSMSSTAAGSSEEYLFNTGSSIKFSNYSYLRICQNSVNSNFNELMNFGTGDFTVESWLYPTSITGRHSIFSIGCNLFTMDWYSGSNYTPIPNRDYSLWLKLYDDSVTEFNDLVIGKKEYCWFSNQHIIINKWTHVALVRKSGYISVLVDGTPVFILDKTTGTLSQTVANNTNLQFDLALQDSYRYYWNVPQVIIGEFNSYQVNYRIRGIHTTYIGYMQDIRFTKKAVYDVTPSTPQFELPTELFTPANSNSIACSYPYGFNDTLFTPGDAYVLYGDSVDVQYYKFTDINELMPVVYTQDFVLDFWVYPTFPHARRERWLTFSYLSFEASPYYAEYWSGYVHNFPRYLRVNGVPGLGDYVPPGNEIDYTLSMTSRECILSNQWNYIAYVNDSKNKTLKLYVNGELQKVIPNQRQQGYGSGLGGNYYSSNNFPGSSTNTTFIGRAGITQPYGSVSEISLTVNTPYTGGIPTEPRAVSSNTIFRTNGLNSTGSDANPVYYTAGNSSVHVATMPSPFNPDIPEGSVYVNSEATCYITSIHKYDTFTTDNLPFTVEGWIKPTNINLLSSSIWYCTAGLTSEINFRTVNMIPEVVVPGASTITGAAKLEIDTWYYFAITRDSSNVLRFYISDGTDSYSLNSGIGTAKFVGLATYARSTTINALYIHLPSYSTIGQDFSGYISNLRESSEALYTSNSDINYEFLPLSVIPSTLFLLQYPYINTEYKYYDKDANIVLKPNDTILDAETPFTTGVDGSIHSVYCTVPADFSPDLLLARKNFTLEWFAKVSGWSNRNFPIMYLGGKTESTAIIGVRYIRYDSTYIIIIITIIATVQNNKSRKEYRVRIPAGINLFDWHHCALVRADDYLNIYFNGSSISKIKLDNIFIDVPTDTSLVGAFLDGSNEYVIKGYLSNIRLVVDDAIYPRNSVPTEPLENVVGTAFLFKAPYGPYYVSNGSGGTETLLKVLSPLNFDPNPANDPEAPADCMYFNGAQYLNLNDSANEYNIGESKQQFTLELWVYPLATTTDNVQMIVSKSGGVESWGVRGAAYQLFTYNNDLYWRWKDTALNSPAYRELRFLQFIKKYARAWTHIAISYDGIATRMFVNGVRVSTYNVSHGYNYSVNNNYIFRLGSSCAYTRRYCPYNFKGYMSNIRIVRGDCLYTGESGNFVPEGQLTSVPGTVLLLQAPYNSLEFKFQTSPFGDNTVEGLAFLDGYKSLKTSAPLPALQKDFTIEFYFYCTKEPYYTANMIESVIDGRSAGDKAEPFVIRLNEVANKIRVVAGHAITPDGKNYIDVGDVQKDTWSHLALVRKNNSVNIYQDGEHVGSFYSDVAWGNSPLLIGKQYAGGGYKEYNFIGYLSNIRVVDGEAVYGNIYDVVPSSMSPSVIPPLEQDSNTVFLLKVGADFDKSIVTTQIEAINGVLSPALRTDVEIYSALTEGTPWESADVTAKDFLAFNSNQTIRFAESGAFDLFQRSFVFECWLNRETNIGCENRIQIIYGCQDWWVYIDCNNILGIKGSSYYPSTAEIPILEWTHIAIVCDLVKAPGQIKLYINGEFMYVWKTSGAMVPAGIRQIWCLGTIPGVVSWDPTFRGLMSNIRLAKSGSNRDMYDATNTHAILNLATTTVHVSQDAPIPDTGVVSFYFDGSSTSNINISKKVEFVNEFTLEMYIKCDMDDIAANTTGYAYLIRHNGCWSLRIALDGSVIFAYVIGSATKEIVSPPGTIITDKWLHIAVVRNSSHEVLLYVDGLLVASGATLANQTIRGDFTLTIGGIPADGMYTGYISNLLINRTVCLYDGPSISPAFPLSIIGSTKFYLFGNYTEDPYITPYLSNFTPPAGPLESIGGTVFLLQSPYNIWNRSAYRACNAPIIDAANPYTGSPAYAFLEQVNTSWSRQYSKNIISLWQENKYLLNSNSFTIKFWINPKKSNLKRVNSWGDTIYPDKYIVSLQSSYTIRLIGSTNAVVFSNNQVNLYSTTKLKVNEWAHVAVVGDSKRICMFINGILEATTTFNYKHPTPAKTTPLIIGGYSYRYATGVYWNCSNPWECTYSSHTDYSLDGWLSDIQITNKSQLYPTTVESQGPDFDMPVGTVFLYQPSYDTFHYQTSTGSKAFVNNTTIPDDNTGVFFNGAAGNTSTFIKTQPIASFTGDFLIETWIIPTTTTSGILLDGRGTTGPTYIPWYIAVNYQGSRNVLLYCGANVFLNTLNNTLTLNQYNHIAVMRRGGFVTMFVNGTPTNTVFNNATWGGGSIFVGRSYSATTPYSGYIYSIRVVRGNSIYNIGFNPKTEGAPQNTPETAVLINSPLFTVAGINPDTGNLRDVGFMNYPNTSSASVTTVSPINNTDNICYFHYNRIIIIPHKEEQNLANTSWSIELWLAVAAPDTPYRQTIFRKGAGSGTEQQCYALYCNTDFSITFEATTLVYVPATDSYANQNTTTNTAAGIITPHKWTHVLLVSDNITTELFVDGKYVYTFNYVPMVNMNVPFLVGSADRGSEEYLTGYISNLRMEIGDNVRSTNIPVPTTPFPDNDVDDEIFADVSLLLHGDGTNGSKTIIDSSTHGYLLSAMGNCALTTVTNKFGNSSMRFSSAGDYIQGNFENAGKFGTSDFTVEFWVYATAAPDTYQTILSFNIYPSQSGFTVKYTATSFDIWRGETRVYTTKSRWNLNHWHYIAISRVESNLKIFIDGDFISSVSFPTDCTDGLRYIGRSTASTTKWGMFGFIDELRITQGTGRYNSNFSVPTRPLIAEPNTAILLRSPYIQYTYYTYALEGVHVAGNIIGSVSNPRLVEVTADAILSNLYIHNGGTLHINKESEATLELLGRRGIQITSGGRLNIN